MSADVRVAPTTTILTPTGMLGYGYPAEDFWTCIERGVDAICVDSGSTDPGPYQLGLGATLVSEQSFARDLCPMLQAVHRHGIPLFIGSAGGAGTNAQVDDMVALVGRLAVKEGLRLRIATVYADVPGAVVNERLARGKVKANVRGELPSVEDVDASEAIVAQMGAEPFTAILDSGEPFDVVVAGRAYDPSAHAAWCLHHGVEPGIAWHSGKILECGGACAEPKGSGVLAHVWPDAFELTPMSPGAVCTPLSVAAHTLYEKSRPDLLAGPAGVLDVRDCMYTAKDERTVRVTGSRHMDSALPTLKLEGASIVGHRAVFIGAVRDPILIAQIDTYLRGVEETAAKLLPDLASGEGSLHFHVYGRNGVMGDLETATDLPHEIAILGEVTAPTPERAKAICGLVRVGVLHLPYEGQLATAGNLALPLSPMDNSVGPVCVFSLYHVMEADGLDLFDIARHEVGVA